MSEPRFKQTRYPGLAPKPSPEFVPPSDGVRALREAAEAARGMHDPAAPDCAEWADWLDARADALLIAARTNSMQQPEHTNRLRTAATRAREDGGNLNAAVAAWLDGLATRIEGRERAPSPEHEQNVREALAVADVILDGGAGA